MDIPLIEDKREDTCGVLATRMVLSYYGWHEPNIENEIMTGHTTYLRDIKEFFSKRDFMYHYHTKSMSNKAVALEKLEELVNDEWPTIALVNRLTYTPDAKIPEYDAPWIRKGYLGHFVVIKEFGDDYVVFNDSRHPEGPITLDRKKFNKAFQMYFLSVKR